MEHDSALPGGPVDSRIAVEAADWLLRIAEDSSLECRAQFVEWLESSPKHMEEFLLVTAASRTLSAMDLGKQIDVTEWLHEISNNVVPHATLPLGNTPSSDGALNAVQPAGDLRETTEQRDAVTAAGTPRPFKEALSRRWLWPAVAAVLVILVGVAWIAPWNVNTYTTAVGEQRSVQLEDGSLLHLNTHSRVSIRYSARAREVRLIEGEALFEVAHDPTRPFRVISGTSLIQAVGTAFNVYRRENEVLVTVVEGKVEIESAAATGDFNSLPTGAQVPTPEAKAKPLQGNRLLVAGEEADIQQGGRIVKHSTPDIATAVAWRQHRLIFRSNRLEEAAAEFNRYNKAKINIVDAAAAAQRISGTFNANEPAAFARFLEQEPTLAVEQGRGGISVQSR